ncbi:MAG: tetratricopeptide repeat protein [bacterium]
MGSFIGRLLNPMGDAPVKYKHAIEYIRRGKYDDALSCLEQVLRKDSNFFIAWSDKGNVLRHFGRDDEALECYERALRLNPAFPLAWYNKGLLLLDRKLFREALVAFERTLETNPDDVEALTAKGTCHKEIGDLELALGSLNRALKLNPSYEIALVNKGLTLLQTDGPTEALSSFDVCLQHHPNNADALAGKGHAQYEMGQYQQALTSFEESLAINPRNRNVLNSKGNALMEIGQIKQAGECYEKAVQLVPDTASVRFNLGGYYSSEGRYDEALEQYSEAIRLKPDYAQAYYERGMVYIRLNRLKEANECFENARRYDAALSPPIVPASPEEKPLFQYGQLSHNAKAGFDAFNHGDYHEAITNFRKAIPECSDSGVLFMIHWLLGGCYRRIGFHDKAIKSLRTCFEHTDDLPNSEIARVYNDLAITLEGSELYDEALKAVENAAKLAPKYINSRLTGASICMNKGDFDRMVALGKEVVQLSSDAEAVSNSARLAETPRELELLAGRYRSEAEAFIGVAAWARSDIGAARRNLEEALAHSPHNPLAEAAVHRIDMGQTFSEYRKEWLAELDKEKQSKDNISISMHSDPALRSAWEEYERLVTEALTFQRRGRFDDAVRKSEAARRTLPDRGAEIEHAGLDNLLSFIAMDRSEYTDALRFNQRALDLYIKAGLPRGRCHILTNRGLILLNSGLYGKAIDVSRKAALLGSELGDVVSVAHNLGNIGICYAHFGDFRKAIAYHEQALGIDIQYRSLQNVAKDNGNLATCCFSIAERAGDDTEFEEWISRAIEHQNRIVDFYRRAHMERSMEMRAITGLAHIQSVQGRRIRNVGLLRGCLRLLDEATAIARSIGNQHHLFQILAVKGSVFRYIAELADSPEKAMGNLSTSEMLLREVNSRTSCDAGFRHQLGQTYQALIRADTQNQVLRQQQAFLCYEEGIKNIDRSRQTALYPELKISFLGSHESIYSDGIALLMEMYRRGIPLPNGDAPEKLLEFIESCKSRTLLDMLGAGDLHRPTPISGDHAQLFERETTCLSEISELKRPASSDSLVEQNVDEVEHNVWNELEEIYDQMEDSYPEYVSTRRGTPSQLKDIRAHLDPDTALIEYFTDDDHTYVLAIAGDDPTVHIHELAHGSKYWKREWVNLYTAVAQANPLDTDSFDQSVEGFLGLGKLLLDPVVEQLKDMRLLYIVPHGYLHYFPFHAMRIRIDGATKHCAERFEVTYLPSASTLPFCRRNNPARQEDTRITSPLVCGTWARDDRGRYQKSVQQEAEAIGKLLNVNALTGTDCSRVRVLDEMRQCDCIHLAAHGYMVVSEDTMASTGVLLTDGRDFPQRPHKDRFLETIDSGAFLSAREWMNLSLRCRLITLSSCEIGRAEIKPGDELIGMTRSLLHSRAPSILHSLWPVNAESKCLFMKVFYSNWLSNPEAGKSGALKEAQTEMIRNDRFSSLLHWSPYFLTGDWL